MAALCAMPNGEPMGVVNMVWAMGEWRHVSAERDGAVKQRQR